MRPSKRLSSWVLQGEFGLKHVHVLRDALLFPNIGHRTQLVFLSFLFFFLHGNAVCHFKALGWRKSGIKPLHGQRAGFVNRLWQTGVDLTTVQQALGHSKISVTQGYLPKGEGKVQAAVNAIPGGEPAKILAKSGNKTGNKINAKKSQK